MPDSKGPKKISAKAILLDLKAGVTDSEFMDKYGLSFQGLQEVFGQLVAAKLATRGYFEKRAVKQAELRSAKTKHPTCPYCGLTSKEPFVKCPRCDQDTSEWLDTVELTKILSFE